MSTSATNKSAIGLIITAVVCVAVTNINALFGHGIRSNAMDFMFLYPLCGSAVELLLDFALRRRFGRGLTRLARNMIHSAIATLTLGAMLWGILTIAGGSSAYAFLFPLIGRIFSVAGLVTAMAGSAASPAKKSKQGDELNGNRGF